MHLRGLGRCDNQIISLNKPIPYKGTNSNVGICVKNEEVICKDANARRQSSAVHLHRPNKLLLEGIRSLKEEHNISGGTNFSSENAPPNNFDKLTSAGAGSGVNAS
mmetsp:Transcript_13754/g.20827  ORF Transcript_13754/g.20827 Transcript_13754/m.20827 type:complete len:106 (+) Transcript_13754:877-1194(+)